MLAILAPSHPVLQEGPNALNPLRVGQNHLDQRLLGEAIVRHRKALRGTRQALTDTSATNDAIMATVSVLTICELFDTIRGSPSAWLGHMGGFDQVLLSRGPDSLRSKLAMLVFYQSRYPALTRALLRRTADPLSSPEWRAVLARMPLGPAGVSLNLALQIPYLLQRYDVLALRPAIAVEDVQTLLSDCERVDGELRQWHTQLQQSAAIYTVLDVGMFPTYAALVSDRTLPDRYSFANQKVAFLFMQYWSSTYFLRGTMAYIREYLRELLNYCEQAQRDLVKARWTSRAELDDLVFFLCRCIPGLAEHSTGAHGHTAMFLPLRIATIHYQAKCSWDWVSWIEDMKAHIFYIRPPIVKNGDYPVVRSLLKSEV